MSRQNAFLITGAAGDIGRAIARRLAAGARLALLDLDEAALARAAAELPCGDVRTFVVDVSDEEEVAHLRDELAATWGPYQYSTRPRSTGRPRSVPARWRVTTSRW